MLWRVLASPKFPSRFRPLYISNLERKNKIGFVFADAVDGQAHKSPHLLIRPCIEYSPRIVESIRDLADDLVCGGACLSERKTLRLCFPNLVLAVSDVFKERLSVGYDPLAKLV